MTDNTKLKQGSPEWHEARRGKITSIGFAKVLSTRGNTRLNYMRELILERKTGIAAESFSNEAMEWGTQTEPMARSYYEKFKEGNAQVKQVGFIDYVPKSEVGRIEFGNYVGVSPDGLVGDDGCIEIKCPNSSTHLGYIAKNVFPKKYEAQVQGILWVTGRDWCDFISFDPRVVEQPYWFIQVPRDQDYIDKLAAAVSVFIDEMVKMRLEMKDVDPQLLTDVVGSYNEDEWLLKRANDIRGRCLHGYVVAQIGTGMTPKKILEPENKADLLELYKFSLTGK